MAWQITSYPALSEGEKQNKLDWIASHYQEYEQAKNDTYEYGPLLEPDDVLLLDNNVDGIYDDEDKKLIAYLNYSNAVNTIVRLREEYDYIRQSHEVWNNGISSWKIPYDQYLTESPYLSSFARVGRGSENNESNVITVGPGYYTLGNIRVPEEFIVNAIEDGGHFLGPGLSLIHI